MENLTPLGKTLATCLIGLVIIVSLALTNNIYNF